MMGEELRAALISSRNADGGWPSRKGRSWTEPTALALIALQGTLGASETRSATASWLARRQSADGGWSPCSAVPASTWVTSLALLALAQEDRHSQGCTKGAAWLSSHVYPELNTFQSLLEDCFGISPPQAPGSSPWFPGTAGWVVPTAFAILALSRWLPHLQDPSVASTIHRSQQYLLSRRCFDGGWNHGGSLHRSEASPSYAETTGLALLALANCSAPSLTPAVRLAESMLPKADSTEGICWLLLGLAAHGLRKDVSPLTIRPKTTQDFALQLITLQSLHNRNPFFQPAT
jgi:hypothetical protein